MNQQRTVENTERMAVEQLFDPIGMCEIYEAAIRPDPIQTVDEFSDQHIELPSHVSEAGRWRTARTPFLREIMRCLSASHPCRKVVFIKPVQIGGTQVAANWVGYTIARSPAAMLFYEPSLDSAKRFTKEKLDPMIAATPILKARVREPRSRDSSNTTFRKEFPGGFLNLLGTNSSVAARSTSAARIVLDEVDEYEIDVGHQGDPIALIEKRAASYSGYKIYELSTPKIKATSIITREYLSGSRGRYYVPCPFCGHMQALVWTSLIYTFAGEKKPDEAAYQCAQCERLIGEHYKTWMMDLTRANWVHEDPENPIQSFHLNLLYQPYGWAYPWSRLAKEYIAAIEQLKAGNEEPLKTFKNTVLAVAWEERGDRVDHADLQRLREVYEAPCPSGVLVLTAAVDVQDNRLEAEICGWGRGEESWSIEYKIFEGSPARDQVWQQLVEWLQTPREHASGHKLRVECLTVDTGGHYTKEAYLFVRRYRGRCYAVKGSNKHGAPLTPTRPSWQADHKILLLLIGTVSAKDTIFARFKLPAPGPGYMHFPSRDEYDEEYFAQLASEEKVLRTDHRGVPIGYAYQKIRTRNEALDLKVYNLVAVVKLNPHPHWDKLAARLQRPPQLEIRQVDDGAGLVSSDPIAESSVSAESQAEPHPVAIGAPEPPSEKPDHTNFVTRYNPPRIRTGGFVKGWR